MVLDYEPETHSQELETVLHDYTEWFLQVTSRLFYPVQNDHMRTQGMRMPVSFDQWFARARSENSIQPTILKGIDNLHHDLKQQTSQMLDDAMRTHVTPEYSEFTKLTVLFEEFMGHLRRLEKDTLLEGNGIDVLTGLRTHDVMEKDIRREMDRLARQGKTFALALVRIDHFADMKKEMTPEEVDERTKIVAELIKKSMRSFDDAYRLDDGMFVLSLKQTESQGGIRALKRLKGELDRANPTYRTKGQMMPLSLSSCIGEPNEGEEIAKFLANLQQDLDTYKGNDGSVLEYYELSPLQRYVRDQEQGRG